MTTELAIRTEGLTKRFGDLFAVDHLDLQVPRGSVFGLIGPNGAGKTTTFAILASLVSPTQGTVEVGGLDPGADPRGVRRMVGYMPDVMGVYDGLRVGEYLEFFAAAYRLPHDRWPALVDGLLELVDLGGKRDAMVDSLSRGMKQRLSLARALVHDPDILILDEPTSGLDPLHQQEFYGLVRDARSRGATIFVSSHVLSEVEQICDRVGIVREGRLVTVGPIDQLIGAKAHRLEIELTTAVGAAEVSRLPGLEQVKVDGAHVSGMYRGTFDPLLAALAGQHVVSFVSREPSLEEIFLSYYQ
jgi:ABC-2 type transport system ATP-binding protein